VNFEGFYDEWWSKEDIDAGLKDGSVKVGPLRINARNRREAFVQCPDLPLDVFIDGDKARNRALNGDLVAVKLLPKNKWRTRQNMNLASDLAKAFEGIKLADNQGLWQPMVGPGSEAAKPTPRLPAEGDELGAGSEAADGDKSLQPAGEVVAIVAANESAGISVERERALTQIGVLSPEHGFERTRPTLIEKGRPLPAGDRFVEFRPQDGRVPRMLIPRNDVPQAFLSNPMNFAPPNARLFEAMMTSWESNQQYPRGRIIRQIGEVGEIASETDALLSENNCDHGDFPEAALDVLRAEIPEDGTWQIPREEVANRRDLRKTHRIFTVDPATAKDLDDALHIVKVPAGKVKGANGSMLPAHYEVGVHIADVSYFVQPGNALDDEARRRSTTVYLVNKVLPMLPPLLSEELCSLNEGVDRCAYSCIWRMTEDGEMLANAPAPWFGRTVIRSCARLDYGLAQRMVDGVVTAASVDTGNPDDDACWPDLRAPEAPHTKQQVIDDVRALVRLAMNRRKKRFDRNVGGALAMKQTKMSFTLDSNGNPTGVRGYPIRNTNKTIEEYMLMANFLVAQKLILGANKMAFIRHHPPPDAKGMVALVQLLQNRGIDFDPAALGSAAGLHATLSRLEADMPELLMELVYALLRKPMKPARYEPAGSLEQREWRHWALNIPYYTHFTSPIRRYADIVVHRQLDAILNNEVISGSEDDLTEMKQVASHCNEKKEASKLAQDASDKLFLAVLVKRQFEANNPIQTVAIVQDLGPNSFQLLLVDFGLEMRVHAEREFGGSAVRATTLQEPGKDTSDSSAHGHTKDKNKGRNGNRGKQKGSGGGTDAKLQVMSLSMSVAPALPAGAPRQTIVLQILSCMDVVLHTTVVNGSRLGITPRFLRLREDLLQ